MGFALPAGYDLPPLMFTEEELEALVLGVRMADKPSYPAPTRRRKGQIPPDEVK